MANLRKKHTASEGEKHVVLKEYIFQEGMTEHLQRRINLGKRVFKKVIKSIKGDLSNTVFSYVPNTAEVSYYGLIECHNYLNKIKRAPS